MSRDRFRRLILPATVAGAALALAGSASATQWLPLGTGVSGSPATSVNAITTNSAGVMYAGGSFTLAGGVGVNNVAQWNGSAWQTLGAGLNGTVYALAVDGTGRLYAGGAFTASGTQAVSNVARWDGTAWHYHHLNGASGTGTVTDGAGATVWTGPLKITPTTNPADGYMAFGSATKGLTTATSLSPWPGGSTGDYVMGLRTLGLYRFDTSFTDPSTGAVIDPLDVIPARRPAKQRGTVRTAERVR